MSDAGIEPLRVAINAGSHTRDAPADMLNYDPMRSPREDAPKTTLGWFFSLRPRFLVSVSCDLFRIGYGREFSPGWNSGWNS